MQKHLAIGRGVKILDQKNRGGGGFNEPPLSPASLRVKSEISFTSLFYFFVSFSKGGGGG